MPKNIMKRTTILVGAQWGDEGKGKIIDLLTENSDIIVRYQGGNNAGHTVRYGDKKFILHLLPSGILHPGKKCVIGNGVVIDLEAFFHEIEILREDRKSTRLNSSHSSISYAVFCLKKTYKENDSVVSWHRSTMLSESRAKSTTT